MKKNIKIGLIGAGQMAQYHVRGFQSSGADVVAVADTSKERGLAFAEKWGFPGNAYPDLKAMLKAHPDLDAVSVITPNKFHHPLVLQALNAGLHVFCEKPPALNAREMAEMAETAKKKRKILMFDLNNRARLDSLYIHSLIEEGKIGHINSAQATWQRRTGIPCFGGWFMRKEMAGGGPLIDLLHMIDLALWFMEYPEPEYVLGQTFDNFINNPDFQGAWGKPVEKQEPGNVETACHGFIRFKSGQVLTVHNSWAEMVKEEDVYVTMQGSEMGIRIRTLNEQNACEIYSQIHGASEDKNLRFRNDVDMGRTRMPGNFVQALKKEAKPLSTPEEALKLMKIIDALYLSASTGKPVKILKDGCKAL